MAGYSGSFSFCRLPDFVHTRLHPAAPGSCLSLRTLTHCHCECDNGAPFGCDKVRRWKARLITFVFCDADLVLLHVFLCIPSYLLFSLPPSLSVPVTVRHSSLKDVKGLRNVLSRLQASSSPLASHKLSLLDSTSASSVSIHSPFFWSKWPPPFTSSWVCWHTVNPGHFHPPHTHLLYPFPFPEL